MMGTYISVVFYIPILKTWFLDVKMLIFRKGMKRQMGAHFFFGVRHLLCL
jgi:hypothetical protein